ncbi:MAG: CBS domain-containing protein [Gemmatimonadota bacterium]|jgi:CBS domain-containing protein
MNAPASSTSLDRPVRDIMQTDVTTVAPGLSVRELTRILSEQGISGAPVTAADGRLIGVVSTSDVVRLASEAPDLRAMPISFLDTPGVPWDEEAGDDEPEPVYGDYFLPEEGSTIVPALGDEVGGGPMDEMAVEDIMTPVPFTVQPTTTIRDLANFLLRGRIHRAVVTEDGRCVGIVTTTDILRAVAEAG